MITVADIQNYMRNQKLILVVHMASGILVYQSLPLPDPFNFWWRRSIENATVGLGQDYNTLMNAAITSATTGERVFCGPVDDPFFVDLAGAFDVGNFRPEGNTVNALSWY